MWGRGQRGNNAACLALTLLSLTSLASHKWTVLFQVLIPRWVGLCTFQNPVGPSSGLSWDWEFPLPPQPPIFDRGFEALVSRVVWSVSLPSCSSQLMHTQMWDHPVCQLLLCCTSLPPWFPISAPPTNLDECFFNSLVVRCLYSLIFWQVWLFFVLNWLLSFFWLCKEAKHIYLCFHLCQKLPNVPFLTLFFLYSPTKWTLLGMPSSTFSNWWLVKG